MLSEDKLQKFRESLELLRRELEYTIALSTEASKPVELDQSLQGRVSRGDALQQQAVAKAGLERNRLRLRRVIRAMNRIEDGDYGFCLECGDTIVEGRLMIMPDSNYCLNCSEKIERGPA